jgi:fatty-acyl-CoA synthase
MMRISINKGAWMFPGNFVATTPDKPAVVRPSTGEQLTYRQLDERSIRLARHLRGLGLKVGDHLALVSSNDLRVLEVYWAALRSGLYITVVNWHLTADEAGYIVNDCGATVLIASADAARAIPADPAQLPGVRHRLVYGGELDGFDSYDAVRRTTGDATSWAGHALLVGHHRQAEGNQTRTAGR